MKLKLIKKYELENIRWIYGCAVLDRETAIFLIMDNEDKYALLYITPDKMKLLPLDYLETFLKMEGCPVLFSKGGGFGIIKNSNELFYYQNINSDPVRVEIENKKLFIKPILPLKVRLGYPSPISNTDILPICFQHTAFRGNEVRYIAFLNLNIEKQKAKWESWTSLDPKNFPVCHNEKEPPKIDSVMMKGKEIFVYTSGAMITSVNKWGMDYYGIVKITPNGEIVETLLDSGNLHEVDQKKRGVNGAFSSSQKYAFLMPVFQCCEWKGRQKLFSIELKEMIDIVFPRGFGKYPQIMEHFGNYFWVFLQDEKYIAICEKV